MSPARLRTACVSLILLVSTAPAHAIVLADIDVALGGLSLSGSGPVALGPAGPGYTDIDTTLEVTQSAVGPSTLSALVEVDDTFSVFTLSVSSSLFLDLSFTDDDPVVDFHPGFAPGPVVVSALASKPLVTTIEGTITSAQLLALAPYTETESTLQDAVDAYNADHPADPIDFDVVEDGVEFALGVDLNGNGFKDAISYGAASFLFGLALDTPIDVDPVSGAVSISATGLAFNGGIADLLTDPPFSFDLSGDISGRLIAVSEPVTVALLALGFVGALRPRRARR